MSGETETKEIESFVASQLGVAFRDKSFSEEETYDLHLSSMFVSVAVLSSKEDNHSSLPIPHRKYDVMFKLRMGNAVRIKRLQSVLNTLCGMKNLRMNNTSSVYLVRCHIFDDSENILCNLTLNGDCDEVTTSCKQRNGTTSCECRSGFEKRYETDKFCRDVNECEHERYNCLGGRCDNTHGNWSCICDEESFVPHRVDAYTLNCTEVHVNACITFPHFECRNGMKSCINDTWECDCRKGAHAEQGTEALYICEDEDECFNRNSMCSGHGKCKNQADGFTCDCYDGYDRNDTDPFNVTCIDVDECLSPDYSCVHGLCHNTDGNWTCSCNLTGFDRKQVTPNVITCEDIDECTHTHYCCGGECTNTFGNWTCDCNAGFTKYTNGNQITCEGGYQYVMSLGFAVTNTIGENENELKVYLQYQIKYVYEASFPNNKVRVEILSVSKEDNTLRRKRKAENFKANFVLHLDEQKEQTELKKTLNDFIKKNCSNGMCEQANEQFADTSFGVLLSGEVEVDDEEGVCVLPSYNLCDPQSTHCKYGNGTTKCECSKGFVRKSEFECTVSTDACTYLPCDNGGTCRMVNVDKPNVHFECICPEDLTGLTCTNEQRKLIAPEETDNKTIFIVTGSILSCLVIVMSIVVLVVCRWKRSQVKEAAKLLKKRGDRGSVNYNGYWNNMNNMYDDNISQNSFRTFPRILSHGRNAGNFKESSHFKGSLPNITHADTYFYRGDQRRFSVQEKRRFSNYDKERHEDQGFTFERNLTYPRHGIDRPPSPKPDYQTSNVGRGGIPTNFNRRSGHFDEFDDMAHF